MNWTNSLLSWIPIVLYIVLGRWIGARARRAWIMAQNCRVQGRCHAELEGPLPHSFYLFFPYTAVTRRIHACVAEFMVDRDKNVDDLTGEDLTYVRAHMLFWPIRVAANLLTGCLAIHAVLMKRRTPEKRIYDLQKRRDRLKRRISTLQINLHAVNAELDELVDLQARELVELKQDVAHDFDAPPRPSPERGRAPLRPTPAKPRTPPTDKRFLN